MGDKNIFLFLAIYFIFWVSFFFYRFKVKKDWYKWWHRPFALIYIAIGVIMLIVCIAGMLGFIEP
tara:strand:- start:497 stop:691 length:195 start_codon:yes stop_codon:yes gene_type:complete